jgi:hypothetical protein
MASDSPISSSPAEHLSFFRFPPKIRLQLYSEFLIYFGPIIMRITETNEALYLPQFKGLYPDLLRVSKQVHSEASPLLYAENCFRFV